MKQGDKKISEKTPPGWNDADVQGLDADEPFALAWYLHDKGVKPSDMKSAEALRCVEDYKREANSASSLGQLNRPNKTAQESAKEMRFNTRLLEAGAVNDQSREIPVYIISEGMGNRVDKHWYTKEALASSFMRFDGAKAYADHPSKTDEVNRPERSVKEIVGYYHSPKYVEVGGVGKIKAVLKINQGSAFDWVWDMLKEALDYSTKYPDRDYIGISINADGVVRAGEGESKGVNFVDSIERVISADVVTQPGAGGKPLREVAAALRESVRKVLEGLEKKGGHPVKDQLMKAVEALKATRAKMGENKDHAELYGPALDEVAGMLSKLADDKPADAEDKAEGKEGEAEAEAKGKEMAPPPDLDGQLKPVGKKKDGEKESEAESEAESEEAMYAKEAERFRVGKMSAGEAKLFEKWSAERAKSALIESAKMVDRKLKESGLPEQVLGDLRLTLCGKDEKYVEKMIEARKALMAEISGNRATGSGAKGGSLPPNKLSESLAKSGVPMRA